MNFDGRVAQKIANQVMANLGYNINIMNHKGIIIGSGNVDRIGCLHETAVKVIYEKKTCEITSEEAKCLNEVKEGINMPIIFSDKVIGVVGITGDPQKVRNIAMLVKMTVEIMVEQEVLKERFYSHQNNKTYFINNLLSENAENDTESIIQWANSLNYDMNIPRVACLLKFICSGNGSKHMVFGEEKIWDELLSQIKTSVFHSKQDISIYLGDSSILIFKTVQNLEPGKIKSEINKYLTDICQGIPKNFCNKVRCFVGSYHEGIPGYRKSYNEVVSLCKNLGEASGALEIYFLYDCLIEYLFTCIPKEQLEHVLKPYIEAFEKGFKGNMCDMVQTVESLIENDFNYDKSAKHLFIHRNTVVFRFDKIKKRLNLNTVINSRDKLVLWMIVLYNRNRRGPQ